MRIYHVARMLACIMFIAFDTVAVSFSLVIVRSAFSAYVTERVNYDCEYYDNRL